MQGLFHTETIEDYTCIKCSIRHYLATKGSKIRSKALKKFLVGLVTDQGDLDEDSFKKAWKKWKQESGDPSKLTLDFIKRNISRSMQLVKPPNILCVHINRVFYSKQGNEVLNSSKVDYPAQF